MAVETGWVRNGGRFFRKVDGMVRGEEWRRGVERLEWAGRVWFEARLLRM
jgi:hypothetical protein